METEWLKYYTAKVLNVKYGENVVGYVKQESLLSENTMNYSSRIVLCNGTFNFSTEHKKFPFPHILLETSRRQGFTSVSHLQTK